jgi:hypothetical protein
LITTKNHSRQKEGVMPDEKDIFGKLGDIYALMGIVGFIGTGAIFLTSRFKKKFKPIRKSDGFYYDKSGKKRYCPVCYETSEIKALVIEGICKRCKKNFFPTPIILPVKMSPKRPRFTDR